MGSRNRKRCNSFKLKEDRFSLDTMKKFFTVKLVRHCNRLSRVAVSAPALEVPTGRLDGTLSILD